MPERPHSRKVKIEEGTAEVKKGEKIQTQVHASDRQPEDREESGEKDS